MSDQSPPFWQLSFWPAVVAITLGIVTARFAEDFISGWWSSRILGLIVGGIVGGLVFSFFAVRRPTE